jgi:hypothetical protein
MNSCYDNEMLRSYALFVVYVVLVKRKEMWHNNNDFFLSPPTSLFRSRFILHFEYKVFRKKNHVFIVGAEFQ